MSGGCYGCICRHCWPVSNKVTKNSMNTTLYERIYWPLFIDDQRAVLCYFDLRNHERFFLLFLCRLLFFLLPRACSCRGGFRFLRSLWWPAGITLQTSGRWKGVKDDVQIEILAADRRDICFYFFHKLFNSSQIPHFLFYDLSAFCHLWECQIVWWMIQISTTQ